MKKILILAYDFPPFISVGGLRPNGWFNYLKEFGYYPVVVTRQFSRTDGTPLSYVSPGISESTITEENEKGTIVRTPYKPNLANKILIKYGEKRFSFIRKAISAWYEFLQFVFLIGPRSGLFFEADKILRKESFSCIIATGDPFVLFKFASILGKKYGIPWIADYRDPWTEDIPLQKKKPLKYWSKCHEKRILKNAAAVITVSEFVKAKTKKIIGPQNFFIIPNGYDQELIDSMVVQTPPTGCLTIGFAGTVYNWNPVWIFLRVIDELVKEEPELKIRINFIGTNIHNELIEAIESKYPKLKNVVGVYGKKPQSEILKDLSLHHLLLLFNYYSFMGTKIYEYLGLKRKILLCFTNDPESLELKKKKYKIDESSNKDTRMQENLILSTNGGVAVKDTSHLKSIIVENFEELKKTKSVLCNSKNIEYFSRRNQVSLLSKVFNEVIEKNGRFKSED